MTESSPATSPATEPAATTPTTPPTTPADSSTTTSLLDPATDPAKPTEPAKTEPAKEGDRLVAPETYADFKVPDGFTLNKETAAEAGTLFKSLGLTQEQAQSLVDFYGKEALRSQDQSLKSLRETRDGWVADAKKQFGADIAPGGKVIVEVGRMLDSIGDTKLVSEFKSVMNLTGAGDHPAFIGVLARLASRFGEGTAVNGKGPSPHGQGAPAGGRRSAAQEMYPTLPSAGA